MPDYRPIGDRIVVLCDPRERVTEAGIHLPETAEEKYTTGVVQAVGSGHLTDGGRVPLDVEVGDRVVFSEHAGNKCLGKDENGQQLLIMGEEDVQLVVLEPSRVGGGS